MRGSVGSRFDEANNGITAMRMLLALAVIAFHVWPIGGFGPDPLMLVTSGQSEGGGTAAVLAFFALSGFLLASSRERLSRRAFIWRRALRILPGYWVCVALTAVLVGPGYLASTWLIGPFIDGASTSLLSGNPSGPKINGSIWTLWPEVVCYAALLAMPVRVTRALVPAAAVLALAAYIAEPQPMFQLAIAFFTGASMRLYPSTPLYGGVVAGLVLALAAATAAGFYNTALPLVLAYVIVWAAVRIPLRWTHDLSYGTYIYAFPIAQCLTALGLNRLGIIPLALACVAVTLPIAAASWYFVERPALQLKRFRLGWRLERSPAVREAASA
jgi:peptidoglycan/LPS O-acetylase OafA/YrhL